MVWTCCRYSALVAMLTLFSLPASAELKKVRTVEGITEYSLENGMRVLFYPDASRPQVTVNVTYFVGSRHEGYGEAGMAHLLEHMVFKGTPDHPDIPAELTKRGARFNGTTWLDRTNYYETLPASQENLEFALRLEADRMLNSLIRGEDLASEMTVVRNEFERGENSPSRVLLQRMMSAAYEWHNYGKTTIGNRADIERVPVENLRDFYRRFYQPDNALLVIAGKFDAKAAEAAVSRIFGALPRPERKLNSTYTEEPAQDGERQVMIRRVGGVAQAGLLYHIPAGSHPEFAAVDILAEILTDQSSGRLYEALVRRRLAASISGATFALHDPGVMFFTAEAADGTEPRDLLSAMAGVVEQSQQEPFTQAEVDKARRTLLARRERQASETRQVAIQLSEWAAQGDWRLYFVHRDRLEMVTAENVNRAAAAYLQKANRTAGLYLPSDSSQRIGIPQAPPPSESIGDYQGRQVMAAGEEFPTEPTSLGARVVSRSLSPNVDLVLLPKKTRGATALVSLQLDFGNLAALRGRGQAAELVGQMMTRGTQNYSRSEFREELDRYSSRLSVSTGGTPGRLTAGIRTTRENLLPVLEMLYEALRRPTFPEEELNLLREESLAAMEQQASEPTALAMSRARRELGNYPSDDPRYVASFEEQMERLKAVSAEDVQAVWAELMGGASGTVVVVGDFDAEAVERSLERLLGDWQTDVPAERIPRQAFVNETGATVTIRTPDKANAAYMALQHLPIADDHPDMSALQVGNFILGGGSLSSRLADRVRQQEGLSYGIQSFMQPNAEDAVTAIGIFAISNPLNVERVRVVIAEELERLVKEGITADELENAKRGLLQQRTLQRADESGLSSLLMQLWSVDRTFDFTAEQESAIAALSVNQVNSALRKWLKPEKFVVVLAGDIPEDAGE